MKFLIPAMAVLSLGACKGDESSSSNSAPKVKESAPAKMTYKKVGTLGVEIEVAEDTNIDDKTKTAMFPTATVWGASSFFITKENEMMWNSSVEKIKKEIEGEINPFKKFTKEEAVEGGIHLEYQLESMVDQKPIYGFTIRRTIGGAKYDCSSNLSSEALRANIVKRCLSLRAAK